MTAPLLLAAAAVYFLVATGVGLLLLRLAGWDGSRLAPAVAPAFGAAGLGLQLWAFGLVGIPWNALTLLGPWVIVGLLFMPRLVRMLSRAPAWLRAAPRPNWAWLPLGLAALLVLPELSAVVLRPVVGNDAIAIWLMRARVFQDLGRVDLRGLTAPSRHPDYPPLFSLMTNSTWVVTGGISQQLAKATNGVLLLAVAWAIYRAFRPVGGPLLAGIGVLAFVALPSFDPWLYSGYYLGYADFAAGCWMALSALALYTWLRAGESIDLALAVTAAIVAALTKNEGLPFLLALAAVVVFFRRRLPGTRLLAVMPVAIPGAFLVGWRATVLLQGYGDQQLQGVSLANLEPGLLASRAVHIADFALHLLDVIRVDYGWVVLAGLVTLELALVSRNILARALIVLVVLQAAAYLAVYLLAPGDIDYWLNTSADRLTVQLLPLVLVALLSAVAPLTRNLGSRTAVQSVAADQASPA
ncbi:MAG TPA: hypothetical protein VG329_01360 [Candidatus Dormibacteraeota bacterium]|jgi:hypothetical protein|nr:hypothetical protein [Candidatus Dormibacteraeota bacterium]